MMINERIIFANFPYKGFGIFVSIVKECFSDMENFFLNFTRCIYVEESLGHH